MGRSLLFHGAGQPLERVCFSVPKPKGAEWLVRITCCTLCRSDLHTHAGRRRTPTPVVLGHEIVGRVEAFGPEASHVDLRGEVVAVGDRVTWAVTVDCGQCFFCTNDLPQKCAKLYKYGHEQTAPERPVGGGLADHIVLLPRTARLRVPDGVSDRVAAPASCATATVAAVLRHGGPVAGRTVLILGAGMLGATTCAMARSAGARAVIVVDKEPMCLQRATTFGATDALQADTDTLAARITALTDGRGADLVLELAGASASVQAGLSLVRTGGVMVLAGTVAPVGPVALDPEEVVRRMLTIRGVHNYHWRDLETALAFLAGPGRDFPFETLIGKEYSLEEAEQAFAHAHTHPGTRVAVVP
jgi:alcohol dehydrogenase